MVLDSDSAHLWYHSSTTMVPPPKGPTDFWWPGQPGGPWNEPMDEPLWNFREGSFICQMNLWQIDGPWWTPIFGGEKLGNILTKTWLNHLVLGFPPNRSWQPAAQLGFWAPHKEQLTQHRVEFQHISTLLHQQTTTRRSWISPLLHYHFP